MPLRFHHNFSCYISFKVFCYCVTQRQDAIQILEVSRSVIPQLQILTLPSQYIFSLLIFVVRYRDLFLFDSEIHDIDTCFNYNLHVPTTNLTLVQKGVLYSGSRIYNHLPSHIKRLSNDFKQFKTKLKAYLLEHSCYSLEEFCQMTSDHHK